MHQQKYCLTWNSYSDHLRSMLKALMMNEDFSDVTLVTEDRQHIKANIFVLRACSPVFRDILKKEKGSSQIIFLRGVQYSEMESIIQFIYLGEATLSEERMKEFISVAKLLEIEELCNAEFETKDESLQSDPVTSKDKMEEQTVVLDHKTKQENEERRDVVSTNSKFECEKCHKTYSGRGALHNHKKSTHEGALYACSHCDYQATRQEKLTVHIQSRHEGVKYTCYQCGYQVTQQCNLTRHIKSAHEHGL